MSLDADMQNTWIVGFGIILQTFRWWYPLWWPTPTWRCRYHTRSSFLDISETTDARRGWKFAMEKIRGVQGVLFVLSWCGLKEIFCKIHGYVVYYSDLCVCVFFPGCCFFSHRVPFTRSIYTVQPKSYSCNSWQKRWNKSKVPTCLCAR